MIRSTQNCASSEWLAIYLRWSTVAKQLQALDAAVLDRKLSDFVLPRDHYLPLQILALSIDAVLGMSFEDLRRFPGVGQVKIRNLLGVLERILRSPQTVAETMGESDERAPQAEDEVTEAVWSQWREELQCCEALYEPIGRHLDRLGELPRGSWFVPSAEFVALSLQDLHELRGFGAQRVGAIVATVRKLRSLQAVVRQYPGVVTTYLFGDLARAETWFIAALCAPETASRFELQSEVVGALRSRIRDDLGDAYAELDVASDGKRRSRSRLHQMRRDAADVMRLRWPRGEMLAAAFLRRVAAAWEARDVAAATHALAPFFPLLRADHRTQTASPLTKNPIFPTTAYSAAQGSRAIS